ncbi:MAG: hypothetical protein PHV34_22365 [Verrucomicrobiae bacterium]|nr:hypothetical protein [Verrucomicrobiae bacterium]
MKAIIGGVDYYFSQDILGNVIALTDASGNLVEQYWYDIYGRPTIKDGSYQTLSTAKTPFLFTGREYDSETGLYHYRARAYSPDLGRFLQADRIKFSGGDVNLYRYCANNPVNLMDPYGLWTFSLTVGGTAGAGIGGTYGQGFSIGHDPAGGLLGGWSAAWHGHGGIGVFLGASASGGVTATATNAKNVCELMGSQLEVGGSVGVPGFGPTAGGAAVMGLGNSDYIGMQGTFGVGAGLPLELHGFLEATVPASFGDFWPF